MKQISLTFFAFVVLSSMFFLSCDKNEKPEIPETPEVPDPTLFVSKDPSLKNLLIEEFTGRRCQNCPDGHRVADNIIKNNKDRVYSVRIHYIGGYSMNDYPKLQTEEGDSLRISFRPTGLPSAMFNRAFVEDSSYLTTNRFDWEGLSTEALQQPADVNIATKTVIDTTTRTMTCEVQLYYTNDVAVGSNKLFLVMTQDSIIGSQEGRGLNPAKMVVGGYIHDHILRSYISSIHGDVVSPTKKGTFISKKYTYQIPQEINEIAVDLSKIHILSFVCKTERDIMNVSSSKIIFK